MFQAKRLLIKMVESCRALYGVKKNSLILKLLREDNNLPTLLEVRKQLLKQF